MFIFFGHVHVLPCSQQPAWSLSLVKHLTCFWSVSLLVACPCQVLAASLAKHPPQRLNQPSPSSRHSKGPGPDRTHILHYSRVYPYHNFHACDALRPHVFPAVSPFFVVFFLGLSLGVVLFSLFRPFFWLCYTHDVVISSTFV